MLQAVDVHSLQPGWVCGSLGVNYVCRLVSDSAYGVTQLLLDYLERFNVYSAREESASQIDHPTVVPPVRRSCITNDQQPQRKDFSTEYRDILNVTYNIRLNPLLNTGPKRLLMLFATARLSNRMYPVLLVGVG